MSPDLLTSKGSEVSYLKEETEVSSPIGDLDDFIFAEQEYHCSER